MRKCKYCVWERDSNGNLIAGPEPFFKKKIKIGDIGKDFIEMQLIPPDGDFEVETNTLFFAVKINYCPMCGRRLNS